MARQRQQHCSVAAAALLLLVVASAALQQAAATPARAEFLRFLRPDAPSLEQEAQQFARRKLQQDPTFEQSAGPFPVDGFGFGFGGINPAGGAFDGLAVNIYNILFKDVFSPGLNEYLARSLSNSGIDPLNFVDPAIAAPWRRDVVSLVGYDYADKYVGQYLTRAKASVGDLIDAGCVAPVYTLKVSGGSCSIMDDGSVECERPKITFTSTPLTCNLPYREAASLEGGGWQYKVSFGTKRSGELFGPAGEYNFGASLNVTTPYLGLSLQTRRVANDFGVQQWYQYVGNLVLNELLRIQAALVSGSVDSRILTRQAQLRADAAAGGGARSVADGLAGARQATDELISKVAERMNLTAAELTAGLRAAGALPQPGSPASGSEQQEPQQAAATAPADPALGADGGGSGAAPQQGVKVSSVAEDTETTSDSLQQQLDASVADVAAKAAAQQP